MSPRSTTIDRPADSLPSIERDQTAERMRIRYDNTVAPSALDDDERRQLAAPPARSRLRTPRRDPLPDTEDPDLALIDSTTGLMHEATLLIVDDHALFRRVAWAAFALHPTIHVVGAAADCTEALALARALRPEIALIDLGLPGVDGVETTRLLVAELPDLKVVAVSAWDDQETVIAALRAGARGFLTKNGDYTQLVRSVEAVASGQGFLSPDVTMGVLHYLQGTTKRPGSIEPPRWLTERDRGMLRLIALGASNRQIGTQLLLSEHTVRTYLTDILAKLGLENRVQLAMYAIKMGLA